MSTKIGWVRDAAGRQGDSANPFYVVDPDGWRGWHCEKVTSGCANCYSERLNETRRCNMGTGRRYNRLCLDGLRLELDDEMLRRWTTARVPKAVFVCSMTDWAGEWWLDLFRDKMFVAMALSPHRFYLLTKRPKLAWDYMSGEKRDTARIVADLEEKMFGGSLAFDADVHWPPPNVWLGVSVEDEPTADERIPILLNTPAAHRFISYEPALGPIPWDSILHDCLDGRQRIPVPEWVIIGAESGPNRRPCPEAFVRDTIEACHGWDMSVFVKQISLNGRVSHDPSEWPADLRVQEVL